MNKEILKHLASKYNHICTSITEFNLIMSICQNLEDLDVNSLRSELIKGFFASCYGMGIWISKDVSPNHMKVFLNNDSLPINSNSNKEPNWSIEIPIILHKNIEKYLNNKIFW